VSKETLGPRLHNERMGRVANLVVVWYRPDKSAAAAAASRMMPAWPLQQHSHSNRSETHVSRWEIILGRFPKAENQFCCVQWTA